MYFKNYKLTRCLLLLGIYIERKEGEREKAGKFQLHFCYPANLWLWRNIVHYLDSSLFPSSRSLPFTFCLPYKLSIYSLEGAEQFSSPSLFSWSSWGNMLWKELIIIWHSKLLLWVLISPSHSLSHHHSCFIFQSLSLSLSLIQPLNFVCRWGLVKKLFPSPWCAFFAIVSHQKTHYCPSPHVESAICVNEGLTGVERVTERESERPGKRRKMWSISIKEKVWCH